jgi:drug/metabolite transporter (DMT)-like permease
MHETNILANTSPFWGVVGAIAVLHEPARWVTFAAGALVIAGTIFLVRKRTTARKAHRLSALVAALVTGVLWGVSTTVPTKLCMNGGMSPVAYQLLFTLSAAAGWSVLVIPKLLRGRLQITRTDLGPAFLSSFFGLFVGWVLWLGALTHADASVLAPLNGLTLLFATILGVIVLHERLTIRVLLGGAFTLAGVTLVTAFA